MRIDIHVFLLVFLCAFYVQASTEDTAAACRDGEDNDGDGHIDCDDQDCELLIFCQPDHSSSEPEDAVDEPNSDEENTSDVVSTPEQDEDESGEAGEVSSDETVTVSIEGLGRTRINVESGGENHECRMPCSLDLHPGPMTITGIRRRDRRSLGSAPITATVPARDCETSFVRTRGQVPSRIAGVFAGIVGVGLPIAIILGIATDQWSLLGVSVFAPLGTFFLASIIISIVTPREYELEFLAEEEGESSENSEDDSTVKLGGLFLAPTNGGAAFGAALTF